MGYRVGERAGPYEVLRVLGRGTFGEVLLAEDSRGSRPRRRVALKTVACESESSAGALREARLLRRLRHPHILACEDAQLDSARRLVWLALELMDGDVQQLLDAARQSSTQFEAVFVRRTLAACASALVYVHGEGVLHRDVKPANLLLGRSGLLKLADFGIAKAHRGRHSRSVEGGAAGAAGAEGAEGCGAEGAGLCSSLVGTPYYLAPEIVCGERYGPPLDAWALGICLYELASLQRPFAAGNQLALVRRICESRPPALPAHVSADVRGVIGGLLHRRPSERLCLRAALGASEAIARLAPEGLEPVVTELSLSPVRHTASSPEGHAELRAELRSSEARAEARAALGADVEDPEELRLALRALEAAGEEALTRELRLRLAALREDAAALLRSFLEDSVETRLEFEETPREKRQETPAPIALRVSGPGDSVRLCLLPAVADYALLRSELARRFGLSRFELWGPREAVCDDASWQRFRELQHARLVLRDERRRKKVSARAA